MIEENTTNEEQTMSNTQNEETPTNKCGAIDSQTKKHVCQLQADHQENHCDGKMIW